MPDSDEVEVTHKTELTFHLDQKKIEAIRECLKKGPLKITVSQIDFVQGGRFRGAYEYD